MLSNRYIYKSTILRDRYIEGAINYDEYTSSLEASQNEELNSIYNFEREKRKEEIYYFEIQQIEMARQTIARNEEEKREAQIREKNAEEQKRLLEEEQEKLKLLTPEQRLFIDREKYYKNEIPLIIDEYKRESRRFRKIHNRLQWAVIIGSAIVTSTTGATIFTNLVNVSYILKGSAAFCSLIVTITASFIGYFKYRERSNNLQKAADDIENEYEAIKLGTHTYLNKSRDEAMGIFADRILRRIKEQKDEQQILEQPPDTKQLLPNQ